MSGNGKARRRANAADRMFAQAEASLVEFAKAVASRIKIEFKTGRIDRAGIDERIRLALEQAAGWAPAGVPKFVLKQLSATLQTPSLPT